jgi:hypothetical protein
VVSKCRKRQRFFHYQPPWGVQAPNKKQPVFIGDQSDEGAFLFGVPPLGSPGMLLRMMRQIKKEFNK